MTARLSPQREASIAARWEHVPTDEQPRFTVTDSSRPGTLLVAVAHAPDDVKALATELAAVRAERDEAALLRDFYRLRAVRLVNQRGEAEVANEAWELGQITAEEALRRTDAAIQNCKTVTLDEFRAEREARS